MKRSLFVVAVVLLDVSQAVAQSPQPSAQNQLAPSPSTPAKSPPVAQMPPPAVGYQFPFYPQVPAAPMMPMVPMYAMAQPTYQPAMAPMMYGAVGVPRTITWGPGLIGGSVAAFGRALDRNFGKTHTWTWNHTVIGPVQPIAGPTSYVATYAQPTYGYQLVPVPGPVVTPPVMAPTAYYATTGPPAGSTPPPPLMRSEEAPPAPAPPPPPKASPQAGAVKSDSLLRLGTLLKLRDGRRDEDAREASSGDKP